MSENFLSKLDELLDNIDEIVLKNIQIETDELGLEI